MLTRKNLIEYVRYRLGEQEPRHWQNHELIRWANEGTKEIARRTEGLRTTQTISAVADTSTYTLPTNFIRIHAVEFAYTGNNRTTQLQYLDQHNWQFHLPRSGWPEYWTTWGTPVTGYTTSGFKVFPAPTAVGSFTVYYYAVPAEVDAYDTATASTAVFEIPNGWDDVLIDYVEYKALRRDRDPRWQEAKALYEEGMNAMLDATMRYTDQAGLWHAPTGQALPSWLVNPYW